MPYYNGELYHYGVKGMKWGVRRYQNADGSLTAAGKSHLKDNNKSKIKNTKELKKFGSYTEASTNPKDWSIDIDNIRDKITSKDYDNILTVVKAHNSSLKGQAYADSVIYSNKPLTQRQISKIEADEESRYNTMYAIDKLSSLGVGAGRDSGENYSIYRFTDYDKEFEYDVRINDNGKVEVTGYNWDDEY